MLIIGTAGVFSLLLALIYIGVVSDAGPAFLSKASPGLTLVMTISLIWPLLIVGFLAVEHWQFNKQPVIVFDREQGGHVYLSPPSAREKAIVIPWDQLKISIRQLNMRGGVGLEYPINFSQLEFTTTTPDSGITLGAKSLSAGIGLWQTLHSFMLKDLHCIRGGLETMEPEYRPDDPPRDDIYLFTRRLKEKINGKDFFALTGWLFLTALTLGPLPYILASACSRFRVRHARHRI